MDDTLTIFNDPVKLAAFSMEPQKSYLETKE